MIDLAGRALMRAKSQEAKDLASLLNTLWSLYYEAKDAASV